jgi:hypothetical protein
MRTLLNRASRFLGLSAEEERAVRSVPGGHHPLAKAVSRQRTIAMQALVTTVPIVLGIAGVLKHSGNAPVVLGVACLVEIVWLAASLSARRTTSDRVQELIAAGDDAIVLPVVSHERRKLASRRYRQGLACSFERLLRDVERSHQISPRSRPLPGTEALREVAPEAVAVVALLRSESVRVQGVALTVRLLLDGISSPLYSGNAERLREEINRIRYLLVAPPQARARNSDAGREAA